MSRFLVRADNSTGFTKVDSLDQVQFEGGEWTRVSYVPWAVTTNREVVYAPIGKDRDLLAEVPPKNTNGANFKPPGGDAKANFPNVVKELNKLGPKPIERLKDVAWRGGLRPYDAMVSQERRSMCHTALGLLGLKPQYSEGAVSKVSEGIKQFLLKMSSEKDFKKQFYDKVGKYHFLTVRYHSFGRLFDDTPEKVQERGGCQGEDGLWDLVWQNVQQVLVAAKPLASALNIHDAVGIAFAPGDKSLAAEYARWKETMRAEDEGEMIHKDWRGRKDKTVEVKSTNLPGNLSASLFSESKFTYVQDRKRGVDRYDRIAPGPAPKDELGKPIPLNPVTSGRIYYQELDKRNELFGAGPSGTTGTLLAAAFTFGKFKPGDELFKEYMFAIIGYLVGGGMHTLHESLSILRLLHLEYNAGTLLGYANDAGFMPKDSQYKAGKYDSGKGYTRARVLRDSFPLLPAKFLASEDFRNWRDAYYDIAVLGGTHWRFNNRG